MTRTFKKFSKPVTNLPSKNGYSKTTRPKYVNHLHEDFAIDITNNRRLQIEVQLVEMQDRMEDAGVPDAEIERRLELAREDFTKRFQKDEERRKQIQDSLKPPLPIITTNPTHYQCCLCYQSKPETKMLFISCRAKGIMEKVTRRERNAVNPICIDCLIHEQLNRDECPWCRSHGLYLVKKRYPKKKKTFKKREELRLLKLEKAKKRAIKHYAIHMGMDPKRDKRYLYIAEQAMNAPLPVGWTKSVKNCQIVYNYGSTSQHYHPHEDIYLDKYVRLKYGKGRW
jgi:hypothetical protein